MAFASETMISSRAVRGVSSSVNHGSVTRTSAETRRWPIHSAHTRSYGACRSRISFSTELEVRVNRALTRSRTALLIDGSDSTSPRVISRVSASYADSSDPLTPGWSANVARSSSYA